MKRNPLLIVALIFVASLASAMGRRETHEEVDRFPDYNKLEYAKPIPKEVEAPAPAQAPKPDPNSLPNFAIEDRPLPQPKVGVPSNTSEPEFPNEMFETSSSSAAAPVEPAPLPASK